MFCQIAESAGTSFIVCDCFSDRSPSNTVTSATCPLVAGCLLQRQCPRAHSHSRVFRPLHRGDRRVQGAVGDRYEGRDAQYGLSPASVLEAVMEVVLIHVRQPGFFRGDSFVGGLWKAHQPWSDLRSAWLALHRSAAYVPDQLHLPLQDDRL
jgi:hypothetical protein